MKRLILLMHVCVCAHQIHEPIDTLHGGRSETERGRRELETTGLSFKYHHILTALRMAWFSIPPHGALCGQFVLGAVPAHMIVGGREHAGEREGHPRPQLDTYIQGRARAVRGREI